MKTRIEFNNVMDAIEHARNNGGWIALSGNGLVRWYSPEHTLTPIAAENPDYIRVATWGDMVRFIADALPFIGMIERDQNRFDYTREDAAELRARGESIFTA